MNETEYIVSLKKQIEERDAIIKRYEKLFEANNKELKELLSPNK